MDTYEQLYKAALEKARKIYGEGTITESLSYLFPELRESEDERVRKMILDQMLRWKEMACKEGVEQDIKDSSKAIAWLEKQKEQKPAEPQDYSNLSDFERAIHRGFLCAGVENVPVTIIKETAQDCLAQVKPVGWSEEDENMIWNIISIVGHSRSGQAEEMIDWLKSLRPVKQEWSKKDEDKLYQVMETLLADKTVALRETPHCKALHEAYDEMLAWLKSLRPTWKPSEEQMNELHDVLIPGNEFDCDILATL